jgi:hypothetical protein
VHEGVTIEVCKLVVAGEVYFVVNVNSDDRLEPGCDVALHNCFALILPVKLNVGIFIPCLSVNHGEAIPELGCFPVFLPMGWQ